MTRPSYSILTLSLGLVLAGCTVGPRYQRPVIDTPQAYRGPAEEAAEPAPQSLGDARWWTVFQDPQLQELIRVALQQNFDVRIAATRVLQAQAQLGITRADQFPSVNAGADYTAQRLAKTSSILPAFETNTGEVNLSVLWNLDFWGKYRKATEAARANLLASEWGRRAVLDSVISNVATAYFQLRAIDLQLEISKDTLASRQDSLRLTQVLARNGSASDLDVRQAEQLVYTASETIPTWSARFSSKKTLSAFCSAGTQARSLAAARSPSSRTRSAFHRAFPPRSSNAVPTFGRPRKI